MQIENVTCTPDTSELSKHEDKTKHCKNRKCEYDQDDETEKTEADIEEINESDEMMSLRKLQNFNYEI